jgi:hypothetical protein
VQLGEHRSGLVLLGAQGDRAVKQGGHRPAAVQLQQQPAQRRGQAGRLDGMTGKRAEPNRVGAPA